MAQGENELFARLDRLEVTTQTYHHPPVRTVEEARRLRSRMPGLHCKNLFLKDSTDRLWLVVAEEDRKVDLKRLEKAIGAGRLSFGKPDLLQETLGIEPGAVTPFAVINDTARRVQIVFDRTLLGNRPVHCHPLRNDRTTQISPADLVRFVADCGHQPMVVDFDALADKGPAP
ncbi:MAG TPA: prolyl-tRNA synthetase associated domain-containing protein [Candidatus Cybelea sp.]|nr:prolyl-tRNA synthetase associated domain-containing protein [Candidatus Cybelea sp.]